MKIKKSYATYNDYINHQKLKTSNPSNRIKWTNDEWYTKIAWFSEVFNQHKDILQTCDNGLCICARMGQEVVALDSMGLDSIGIDLVANEPYVIQGDMHDLSFSDETFDLVFSNSFDHSLNPKKFISEIERVLKPGGYCFLILQPKIIGDDYAENDIESSKEVSSLFQKCISVVDTPLEVSFHWVYNWKLIMRKLK